MYKDCMSVQEQAHVRQSLTVRPYVPNSPVQAPSFPVYLESQNKLYVPRYYGVDTYGAPDETRLSSGERIALRFAGALRDYQEEIVECFLDSVGGARGGGLLEIPCGRGKTVMALRIIAALRKKTLIIVHKGFLMNQWKERIEQFLPDARIGIIQGQVVDIEDKDIVIGMLQSLSLKTYPVGMFDTFGFTVVDECHHISSEVFCRSLQAIVTPYTLGLSATMNRKDGLTRVFKMFLGDIIYSEQRKAEDDVLVRAIQYTSDDPQYAETKYDWRGNPMLSSMLSNACKHAPRTAFIGRVIRQELREKPGQQVMVLAQQKNILVDLSKDLQGTPEFTCGFYVGGMKESDLKSTETRAVILATYAMAAEALDIKTLTTLVLATPRTDITQAVGRILRVKHERPLVLDIVDSHGVFQRQWAKRCAYYRKNKYRIVETSSEAYGDGSWNLVYEKGMKRSKKNSPADGLPTGVCLLNV
jgi:superfamily II DNA or RNA helicase